MRKSTKPVAKTATHKGIENCTVKFIVGKDFLGGEIYKVCFANGEITTMSAARFNELFAVN
jgi:hypothetical protein